MDVPGTGLDGGDPLLRTMLSRAQGGEERLGKLEGDIAASRDRETAARTAQATALKPKQDELAAKLGQAPAPPEMAAMPAAPTAPKLDTKEMGETLALITALAALGGALTRQPLTAALNNFSAGVHGLVQGNQMVFQNSIKEFETNLQKARTENESTWKKYQAARDKYKTDIAGLQNELKLIAAETNDPIALEAAKRGDIVSVYKIREKQNADFDKVLGTVARMRTQQETHAENMRRHRELEAEARDRNTRLSAPKTPDEAKRQDALFKEFHAAKRKLQDRLLTGKIDQKTHDEELAMLTGQFKGRGMGRAVAPVSPGAPAPAPAAAPATPAIKSFASPEEADAAAKRGELTPGMRITINGQTGTWQ